MKVGNLKRCFASGETCSPAECGETWLMRKNIWEIHLCY